MKRWTWLLLLVCAVAYGDVAYTITILNVTIPNQHVTWTSCAATGVNDYGTVVGSCQYLDSNKHIRTQAWRATNGRYHAYRNGLDSDLAVHDVNNYGHVVGTYSTDHL